MQLLALGGGGCQGSEENCIDRNCIETDQNDLHDNECLGFSLTVKNGR